MADSKEPVKHDDDKKWYVVQTYSTFEKRVQQSIKEKAEREGLTWTRLRGLISPSSRPVRRSESVTPW